MNSVRHWFIQKPTAHNCPVGQSGPLENCGAVFQEFQPTIHKAGCEWIKVWSSEDLGGLMGMGVTRWVTVATQNAGLLKAIEVILDPKAKDKDKLDAVEFYRNIKAKQQPQKGGE